MSVDGQSRSLDKAGLTLSTDSAGRLRGACVVKRTDCDPQPQRSFWDRHVGSGVWIPTPERSSASCQCKQAQRSAIAAVMLGSMHRQGAHCIHHSHAQEAHVRCMNVLQDSCRMHEHTRAGPSGRHAILSLGTFGMCSRDFRPRGCGTYTHAREGVSVAPWLFRTSRQRAHVSNLQTASL